MLLPANYSEDKTYPVLYILHGFYDDQNWMARDIVGISTMLTNLCADGQAEEMIVVLPYIYCSKNNQYCTGLDLENCLAYDNFINDLMTDLKPFIESSFSVAEGRENTAITGFSMGGRESLFIGFQHPEVFGYIGAVCPALGLTPVSWSDMHPGQMQESEMVFESNQPFALLVSAAENDGIANASAKDYHNVMSRNQTEHLWHYMNSTGHDHTSVTPHLYNFMRLIFKEPVTTPSHTHKWSEEWTFNENYHWHECVEADLHESEVHGTEFPHNWELSEVVQAATCTDDGTGKYLCSDCGVEKTDTVTATGHTPVTDKRVEPTCVDTGLTEGSHCSVCDRIIVAQKDIPALGHSWDKGKVTTPTTTTAEGVKTYTCTICGATKTESIPKIPSSSGSSGSNSEGSGSSSGSSGSSRPSSTSTSDYSTTNPTVNGTSQSWPQTVSMIDSGTYNGATVTISGNTDIPADVIAVAAKKGIKLEVKVNDTLTWVLDTANVGEGAKSLSVSDTVITDTNKTIKSGEAFKDIRVTESKLGTGASLRYNAGKDSSGKFANLFRVNGSALEFVAVVKIDAAGNALLPISVAGSYKIVISDETKLVGDLDNNMVLNALDAALMLKQLVNNDISADDTAKFDFNGDTLNNALDAAALLRWLVNK